MMTETQQTVMDGESKLSTKLPHRQTDNTQTQLLEVKPEVYGDTDGKTTNSYQFYSCLQTAIEMKKSFIEAKEIK